MSEPPIYANICELGGPYYPVKLHAVPRVGELVKLSSFIELNDGNQSMMFYKVLAVVHEVSDVSDKIPQSKSGSHCVVIHVKRTRSKFFESNDSIPFPNPLN